ncbi:hypothetical protein PSPO01_02296 [Paraphaeosphaeria sporulosa]
MWRTWVREGEEGDESDRIAKKRTHAACEVARSIACSRAYGCGRGAVCSACKKTIEAKVPSRAGVRLDARGAGIGEVRRVAGARCFAACSQWWHEAGGSASCKQECAKYWERQPWSTSWNQLVATACAQAVFGPWRAAAARVPVRRPPSLAASLSFSIRRALRFASLVHFYPEDRLRPTHPNWPPAPTSLRADDEDATGAAATQQQYIAQLPTAAAAAPVPAL